jgi:H+/Na+-translocating ferredoxin:NAD+ oxidoreductase subunit G
MVTREGRAWRTLVLVGLVAAGAALLVSFSYDFSKDRIAANQRARLLARLDSVLDPALRGRDLATVRFTVTDRELLGSTAAVDVFVATEAGTPAAVIFASEAPDGYNAPIKLLIGMSATGTITGVRAIAHRETPGLGDEIDIAQSDWIKQFDGKSLAMPAPAGWAVKKDEGTFDSITGATVTSRAVVKAVKNTLLYFDRHRDELFAQAARTAAAQNAGTQ